MMAGLFVVWGVALLALLVLGALLISTLRGGARPVERTRTLGAEASFAPATDTLLLYYEEESVRRTPQGDVVLRIPGMAWERDWQDDLVRLEVARIKPEEVVVPEQWGEAEVLAAYDLRAHRMTEIGTDIPVESFAAPVDVFLTRETEMAGLRFGVQNDGEWTLAPPAALPLEILQQAGIPAGQGWAAASISRLRQVCLVRMPAEGPA
jgi:hypothetical protein